MNNSLDKTIETIEKIEMPVISDECIEEIFSTLRSQDSDMEPMLDIIYKLIKLSPNAKDKTYYTSKVLKFYGINNKDILSTRQKFIIESGLLVKVPFLKKSQKECISILLEQLNVKVS